MEEETQGCSEDKERIDTPAVTARLSAVSLTDTLHSRPQLQGKQSRDGVSPSFALAPQANTLSAMAHTSPSTCVGASPAACMDASARTCAEDASSAMCVDASQAACVDVVQATRDAVVQQGLGPGWAEMVPDALVKIFNHLPLEDKLCSIPCVCKTWRSVSQGAPCWQHVDLSEWSYGKHPKTLEKMLLLVVNRSRGCLQEICAPNLKNDTMLRLIAESGSQLQVLRIPDSFVSEACLCEMAPKCASLNYLDISGRFPSRALIESFGENCPFITRLNLNMRLNASNCKSCDAAALSVAEYMPQLKHLEMAYGLLSNAGLKAILERCTSLEHLDLRGCWHVSMDEETSLDARRKVKVFLAPVVENDIYDISEDDDDDDVNNSINYDDYIVDTLENYEDYLNDDMEFFDESDIENMDEDISYW